MGTHRKLRFWTHSGVKVHDNTAAPTSWTDLDLSSVVGKNRALVFVKLKNRDATRKEGYAFRIKGETEEVARDILQASMNNMVSITEGNIAHFVMETNVDGVLEWNTNSGKDTDIWVVGYIK